MFVGVDQHVECRRIDEPFFDQQRFERLDAQGGIGRNEGMLVLVVMLMLVFPIVLVRVSGLVHGSCRPHPHLMKSRRDVFIACALLRFGHHSESEGR